MDMEHRGTQQTDKPGMDPPPYSGPPPGPSYPGPTHSEYPVTNQPQVTVVQPAAVIPAVVITNTTSMGPNPTSHFCRSCNHQVITRVERNPSMKTHLCAALLCLIGFWPCVCIPYCVDSCNKAEHYCPNCNVYIWTYNS